MVAVDVLMEQSRGDVLTPDREGYDEARAVYNAMHDRRPAAILQAVDEADVIAGIRFARENGLEKNIEPAR